MSDGISIAEYYSVPLVRERIAQYCGASDASPMTCAYVCGMSSKADARLGWALAPRFPSDALDTLLAAGADLARSLWDTRHLLFHFDIDYLNPDYPGEPFLHPADTFFKLEPTFVAARRVLRDLHLRTLAVMTGRGYHFTGRVPIGDPVIDQISALAPETPAWLATAPSRVPQWAPPIDERRARAHAGLGLVTEFLAHQVTRRAAGTSTIPIVFDGTAVGSGVIGRECVSLDLSAAGDPLDVRHIRVAFGAYQRHRLREDIFGGTVAHRVEPLVALPRGHEHPWQLLTRGRDTTTAVRVAQTANASIPLVGSGMRSAVSAYQASPVAAFHRSFYELAALDSEDFRKAFDAFDANALPPCVAAPLVTPNDLLLQPAPLQHITRYFLAEGWHPRTIAGLVHSKYDGPYGWGDHWKRLDARTRAEFDVRVFAGLLATGLDQAVDFNCRSAQEKNLCPNRECTHDLRVDRLRLLKAVAP